MGTSIELCIGKVTLSCSTNQKGTDYGSLFQEGDLCRRKTDVVDYGCYEDYLEEKEEFAEAEELFARTLSRILPRLDILGFTLEVARAEYEEVVEEVEANMAIGDMGFFTFEEFCKFACHILLADLDNDSVFDQVGIASEGRFATDLRLLQLPSVINNKTCSSEASFLSANVCILRAESMLQVFAHNTENAEVEVTWKFGPVVHQGWVERKEFHAGARQKQKILIATEGSSDASIIRKSLDILRPNVKDFFNFIDVEDKESYSFWGTGSLVKFAEGLLQIDVLNQILFVLDNDAEGVDAFRKLEKLKLPSNMRAMLLPDLEEFRSFPARGPEGISRSDINGRAAAIECYLDLILPQRPNSSPQVIWSNFKEEIGARHGALDHKGSYSKHFYKQKPDDLLRNGRYDVSKLLKLLDALIHEAELLTPVI